MHVGKQNEKDAKIQGGKLVKDSRPNTDIGNLNQTRNFSSKKAKSVASGANKRVEANQDLIKQLIIDKKILS